MMGKKLEESLSSEQQAFIGSLQAQLEKNLSQRKDLVALIGNCQRRVTIINDRLTWEIQTPHFENKDFCQDLIDQIALKMIDLGRLAGSGIEDVLLIPGNSNAKPKRWNLGGTQKLHKFITSESLPEVQKYQYLLDMMHEMAKSSAGLVLHSDDNSDGYRVLAIETRWAERFFTNPLTILNKPISFFPDQIREPREFYLRKAVSSGTTQKFKYEFHDEWDGEPKHWLFDVSMIYSPGMGCVVSQIRDPDPQEHESHAWQGEFWVQKRLESLNLIC